MQLETELRQETNDPSRYGRFTPQDPDQIFLVASFYVEECTMVRAYLLFFQSQSVTFADTQGNNYPPVLNGLDATPNPFSEVSISYYEIDDPATAPLLSTSHSMYIATIIPKPTSAQQFTIQLLIATPDMRPLRFTATVDAQTNE